MRFRMKLAVFVATCTVSSCSNDPANGLQVGVNNSDDNAEACDPADACYSDEIVAESCEPADFCATREACGVEVLCQQVPNCADPLGCAAQWSRVESCEGLERCVDVDEFCGGVFCHPSELVATDFEQACSKPSDCVPINEGNGCDCPSCPDAAINTDAGAIYETIRADAFCPGDACMAASCEEDLITACTSGICAIRQAQRIAADDFDRSCQTDQECAAVYEGEICAECQCANAAVNVAELDAYNAQFDQTCVSDMPCPCVGVSATCVDGVCRGPSGG